MTGYMEVTVEEALKICGKNGKVLVATQNLEEDDVNIAFISKKREEYSKIFEDVKTVASMCDDFVRQLKCYTEKQDIYNIQPIGIQKIILLRE